MYSIVYTICMHSEISVSFVAVFSCTHINQFTGSVCVRFAQHCPAFPNSKNSVKIGACMVGFYFYFLKHVFLFFVYNITFNHLNAISDIFVSSFLLPTR